MKLNPNSPIGTLNGTELFIGRKLGSGAFADVYEIRDHNLVVKVVHPRRFHKRVSKSQLFEAQISSLLDKQITDADLRRHFCQVHILDQKLGYLIMPRHETTLADALYDNLVSLSELKDIIGQVIDTISSAQQICQFKHQDLHSDNIFLDRHQDRWFVVIGDFGFSSKIDLETNQRIGKPSMSFYDGDPNRRSMMKYGETSKKFRKGYDIQTFLSFLLEDPLTKSQYEFVEFLFRFVNDNLDNQCSNVSRPYFYCISRKNPQQVKRFFNGLCKHF